MERARLPTVSELRKTGPVFCDRDPSSKGTYINSPYNCTPGRSAFVELFLTPIVFSPGLQLPGCIIFFTDWHDVDPNLSPLNSPSSEGFLSKCKWYMSSSRPQMSSNCAEGEFPRFIGLLTVVNLSVTQGGHILIDLFLRFMFLWIFFFYKLGHLFILR